MEGENSERFFDIHLSGIWHMEDAKSGGTGFDIQLRNGFRLGVVDVMFLGWWTPSPSRSATKAGHEWHKEALKLLRVTADRYPIVTEGSLGVAPPETPVGLRFLETRRRADSVIQLSLMCFLVALAISIYSLFEDEFWLLYWALLPVALGLIFGAAASAYIRTSKRSLARFPFVSAKSVKRYYWWTGVVVFLGIFGCGFGALALPKALIESRRAAASKAPALAAFVIPVVAWLTWFAVT
nr:hypothetical protein Ade03nite_21840 [Actinoplanes derwentensis]